jgi:hypothetical protein
MSGPKRNKVTSPTVPSLTEAQFAAAKKLMDDAKTAQEKRVKDCMAEIDQVLERHGCAISINANPTLQIVPREVLSTISPR